jgi:hypothetical protein
MKTVISEEESFIGKIVLDASERAKLMRDISQHILTVFETSASDLIELTSNICTLQECLDLTRALDVNLMGGRIRQIIDKKYRQVIEAQVTSLGKLVKDGEDIMNLSDRLQKVMSGLAEPVPELKAAYEEVVDRLLSKRCKDTIENVYYALVGSMRVFPKDTVRLRHLSRLLCRHELSLIEPLILQPITKSSSLDSLNHLISLFNGKLNEWLQQFHLHCISHTLPSALYIFVNQAFKEALVEAHENIDAARSVMLEDGVDSVDSLIPFETLVTQIDKQLQS